MYLLVLSHHINKSVYLFIQVRPQIEKMKEDNWKIYIPVVYSQIVNGMNYVVKVSECFCLFAFLCIVSL